MIKSLYKQYFQKSTSFLFPLLNIPKKSNFQPIQTYISWEGKYKIDDMKLICMYDSSIKDLDRLKKHPIYDTDFPLDEETMIYVFNFKKYGKDWTHFINGKYSLLSESTKKKIKDYYGDKSPETEYIMTFLYPKDHIKTYSELLDIKIDLLEQIGELCDPYDPCCEDLYFEQQEYLSH